MRQCLTDTRGIRAAVLTFTLALSLPLLGCGAARVPPPAPVAPKYPDFVFPAAPAALSESGATAHQQSGWNYLQAGDTHSADREFSAALKQVPDFYPAETALGYSALARKDASAAIGHFDKALSRNGRYAPALAGKGDALLSQNHPDLALQAFQNALAADPGLQGLRARVDVLKFRTAQQDITAARKAADEGRLDEARKTYQEAIVASPESAFLYRELATVENRAGDASAALTHAQQAAKLDPTDARSQMLIAQIYESQRQWNAAAGAYAAANTLEPSEALTAKIDELRERAAFDSMPEEYKNIAQASTITRAQLAALIGVRLEDLLRRSRAASAPVITDTRSNWASPWILAVTRAGVMDVFPNHTFQPGAVVRRADLAHAVSEVLAHIAAEKPKLAAKWMDGRPHFTDVSPSHLSYPAAARAVSAGVMQTADGGAFQLSRPVTGAEAVQVVDRLEALAASK